MIYNTYGRTGKKVSVLGFGGMRFENHNDLDGCAEMLKYAYDKDVNYFDTAPLYVYDKSEIIFGLALKEMKKTREKKPFYVSTKSAKTTPAEVRRELETSLKRLNVDYIDFYHFWCVLTWQEYQQTKSNGVLKEFEKLKAEGLIKHICVSTHLNGEEIKKLLHDYPFESILLGYSAMNFAYRDTGLDAAANLNRGVAVMNPLGGGIIPQNPKLFNFLKNRPDETVVEAALKFLVNDTRIAVTLVGMGNKNHIDQALKAVNEFQPIPQSSIKKMRDSLKDNFNELCTSCQYCDDCPQQIPSPKIMDVYNHCMFGVDETEIINRLRFAWAVELENHGLDKCTKCGYCESLCTQKLPIAERIQAVQKRIETFLEQEAKKQK
jgi:uncharacterized protein